jgi:hypothetical protein
VEALTLKEVSITLGESEQKEVRKAAAFHLYG